MVTSFLVLMALQMTQDLPARAPIKMASNNLLAQSAREELTIVDRLHSLRQAVEKLPEAWKAAGVKSLPSGTVLTKEALLREIEDMELSAAARWTVLLENTALSDKGTDAVTANVQTLRVKDELNDLPRIQAEMNQRLDQFNSKLKDGILANLASKFLSN